MTDLIITGVTGFLGRHVVEEVLARKMYHHIYGVSRRWVDQEQLAKKWGDAVTMVNGDIRDRNTVERLFKRLKHPHFPDIIHAAAYKHISMAQHNPQECFDVNVNGTENLLNVAGNWGFRTFVFISTDKAAAPISVYGNSKAIAERMVINDGGVVLRFGNVWGSTGSMVNKFHASMQSETPHIEVTDPAMTRYYYPISDAVDYILMATDERGCTIVPKLKSIETGLVAETFKIAYNNPNAEIRYMGIRPGEKMHEQMTSFGELSMSKATVFQDKYVKLTAGEFGELPPGYEGIISSQLAERFTEQELVSMINETKTSKQ